MQRIGEVGAFSTMTQCSFDLFVVLDRDSRQGDQVRKAIQDLAGRLPGYRTQYPFELEHDGLGNEHVPGGEDLFGKACLLGIRGPV